MHKRLRSTIKWGGTVLTVLLLAVWLGSAWWQVPLRQGGGRGAIGLGAGQLLATWPMRGPAPSRGMYVEAFELRIGGFSWWFASRHLPVVVKGSTLHLVGVPLWSLALATGLPSAWLWFRDRRRAPGLCVHCGYDLRGNASGVCPECGAARDQPRP
ncbi:MAG: hypothetical protein KJZ69_04055 [Phycisphaerales bacterium]|nr:hypothetical protein [Phycisphaerales bacterium]